MIGTVSVGATANAWKHLLADEGTQASHVCIGIIVNREPCWIGKRVNVQREAFKYTIAIRIFMATCTTLGFKDVSTGRCITRKSQATATGGSNGTRTSAGSTHRR